MESLLIVMRVRESRLGRSLGLLSKRSHHSVVGNSSLVKCSKHAGGVDVSNWGGKGWGRVIHLEKPFTQQENKICEDA